MTLAHRVLGAVVGAALLTAGLVGAGAPAQAAACSGTTGVTVVIQSENGSSTRCAPGDPGSAYAALESVASVTPVSTQPGFICQINDYPNANCSRTPPASAYWAFFHAPAGGSWTYSQSGASSYNPKPGSSVGFRFGSGAPPSVSPAAPAPAPKPTTAKPQPTTAAPKPTTAAPRATTAAPRGTTATTPAPTSAAARSVAAAESSAAASASASASESGASPSASASESPTVAATSDVSAQKSPSTGSGSSGRLVGGGVLLLALATAIGAVALQRRGQATPTDTPAP
ncbi:MAG: hypothetical protein ABIW49_10905 [Knoellia sp.]